MPDKPSNQNKQQTQEIKKIQTHKKQHLRNQRKIKKKRKNKIQTTKGQNTNNTTQHYETNKAIQQNQTQTPSSSTNIKSSHTSQKTVQYPTQNHKTNK